jgi:RNA polymerase sigma factor (sigma-70 family)
LKKKDLLFEDEYTQLIRRFSSFIFAQIQKTYPQNIGLDRDDLFQEVGIVLWKVLKGEKNIKHQSSYIMRVVNSVVIDNIRSARRQQKTVEVEKKNVGFLGQMEESDESHALVQGALSELSDSRQKVVRLFLLDLDIEEIASICNWTEAKTRNLVYRGLNDIKEVIGKKGSRE